jgi:hypothetical protein
MEVKFHFHIILEVKRITSMDRVWDALLNALVRLAIAFASRWFKDSMMPFTLPHFNCTFSSWRLDGATSVWARVVIGGACQWYTNPRIVMLAIPLGGSEEIILHFLRVPIGTDIAEGDLVEVEVGEQWFYQLVETERVHKNFPNEYAVGYATNMDAENTPFFIDTELGVALDTETGDKISTELYP